MLTIKDYERFCESEYKFAKNNINRNRYTPVEVVNHTFRLLFEAGTIAQQRGVTREEVDKVFEIYKEKVNNLLKPLDKSEII